MDPLIVPGDLDALQEVRDYVQRAAEMAGVDRKSAYKLRLAVDELATNSILYGYQQAGRSGEIEVQATIDPQRLTIVVEDSAATFDPRESMAVEEERVDTPVEERPVGGLGIFLALQGVDQFDYTYTNGHNRNILIVNRS